MGMHKVDYIRRAPGIGDYNALVDAVNWLIDKVNEKKEILPMEITREVKDFTFFMGEEVSLPYEKDIIIISPEDATNLFKTYALTYKETSAINDAIIKGKIVSLKINVTEKVTEKEKKQETVFETVETITLDKPIKWKRGRKKKTWK